MSRQIEVTIQADGKVQIDAVGFAGSDCEAATAFLEQALGAKVQKQRKPEFFAQRRAAQPLRQQGGTQR